jgi:hypothetical protein
MADENDLLALLNSAPVRDGEIVDTLDDPRLSRLRDDLHAVIRGADSAERLDAYLRDVRQRPLLGEHGLEWVLEGPATALPYAELVLEWARVERELPGRLRACRNDECNKFLIDHSKPNTARWCSMADCGNRMKARRHHARQLGER